MCCNLKNKSKSHWTPTAARPTARRLRGARCRRCARLGRCLHLGARRRRLSRRREFGRCRRRFGL